MCMNLYRNIDRSKVQFDFVKHTNNKGLYEDEIVALGGKIYAAPRLKSSNYFLYKKWWKDFLSEHQEYRIIHGHYFTISPIYLSIAHKFNRCTIGHIHASSSCDGMKGRIIDCFVHRIEKVSDICFACSETAGKWAYRAKSFTVLNNAVNSTRFKFDVKKRVFMRQQLGLNKNEKAIFVVANLSEVKNPLGALDIYSAIRRRNPSARLFWAGEGGMRGLMEQKIAAEQIPGVTLLGTRSDVPDLLQAADAFMLCSFSEGLPVVTIEAQAAGLPCLLSSAVTTEAAVTDLCTFLPIDQPELWADAAEKALTAPRRDTRPEIIRAGYDIKETSAWLTNFYLNCKG